MKKQEIESKGSAQNGPVILFKLTRDATPLGRTNLTTGADVRHLLAEMVPKKEIAENPKVFIPSHCDDNIQELGVRTRHQMHDSMAAGIVGSIYGLRKERIRESLMNLKSLEHRLESVTRIRGIEFINDSKATNVNSTWYALESTDKPIIWIAGGVDKGNDYSVLEELVKKRVHAMVCLGVDNTKLHAAFSKHVDIVINCDNMPDAVRAAYLLAHPGDAVLLSPACASFDLFQNYEDKGHQFKNAVTQL